VCERPLPYSNHDALFPRTASARLCSNCRAKESTSTSPHIRDHEWAGVTCLKPEDLDTVAIRHCGYTYAWRIERVMRENERPCRRCSGTLDMILMKDTALLDGTGRKLEASNILLEDKDLRLCVYEPRYKVQVLTIALGNSWSGC
jgi:hypothetical protein